MPIDYNFIESREFLEFFNRYKDEEPDALRLKNIGLPFDKKLAVTQIECRKKATKKIPELALRLCYPTTISIEQCTSERLACFHASLFDGCADVVDLTCGLGVDSYYISKSVGRLTSVEAAEQVAAAARRNFKALGADNVTIVCSTAEEFVDHISTGYSAMFVDPSRRIHADSRLRTNAIKDTVPSLDHIIPRIKGYSDFLLVKASPMTDISQTLSDFPGISDVWILSLRNECKELLFKIDFAKDANAIALHCLNFRDDKVDRFDCTYGENAIIESAIPEAGQTIYQPNASIMKAGVYSKVALEYDLKQISANSHLYLSDRYIEDFPGRKFRISAVFSLSKRDVRTLQSLTTAANITCRNFPMTAEELRKRLKLKDGGDTYIFATTACDKSRILIISHTETR